MRKSLALGLVVLETASTLPNAEHESSSIGQDRRRDSWRSQCATLHVTFVVVTLLGLATPRLSAQAPPAPKPRQVVAAKKLAPVLSFEKVSGDSEARFIARGARSRLRLQKTGAVLSLRRSLATDQFAEQDVRIRFAGASRDPAISGEEELPGKVYHADGDFLGALTANPTYRRVRYSQLYSGIDAVFYGNEHNLEFDFQVAPHANPRQIGLSILGADQIALDPSGDLVFHVGDEEVRLKKPVVYQERNGVRTDIAGRYRLARHRSPDRPEVRLELGRYDRNLPLTIDPDIAFATYFGGDGTEIPSEVKANAAGEIYLFGGSNHSSGLPTHTTFTILGPQPGSFECFLTKLSSDGSTALYTVVFGGVGCEAMDLGNNGNVHMALGAGSFHFMRTLTESTMSLDLLQGAYDLGSGDGPVVSLRADPAGNVYFVTSFRPSSSVFTYELRKVNVSGQLVGTGHLIDAPVVLGTTVDSITALDVDDVGHAYAVGIANSNGLISPTANAFQSTQFFGPDDGFLLRVDTNTGSPFQIDYASYLGGSKSDQPYAVAFDAFSNAVLIAGVSTSPDFPTTPGSFDPSYSGATPYHPLSENFLVKLDLSQPGAQQLVFGTFLTDAGYLTTPYQLTILPGDLPVISGSTLDESIPPFFPLVNSFYPAHFTDPINQGIDSRPFLSVFSADGSSVVFSTYLSSIQFASTFGRPALSANGSQYLFEATSTNESGLSVGNVLQTDNVNRSFDVLVRAIDVSNLSANPYQLTTATIGSGIGTVTVFPGGTPCGVNCMAYTAGTNVTVTAVPGTGSSFTGFSGGGCGSTNPCSFSIASSTTVTAGFALNQYQLTTATIGSGSGSVTVSPSGVSCGVNCTAYDYGTTLTVTATPSAGSSFMGFSGGGCGAFNPCSFTIASSTTVAATFVDLTGAQGYLYALVDVTNADNKLYGFLVDGSGALTPLLSFPVGIGDSGNGVFGTERLAYDKSHKQLYVLHDGFHYVSVHSVDLASGRLTLETGPGLFDGGAWDCAALHPGGSPLVAGDGFVGRLASFAEPGSGPTLPTVLSGGSSTGTARPFSCVFSQDGKFVYTGGNGNPNGGGPTIAGFSVNSTTGDLLPVPGSPFDVGGFAAPYATDSTGRLFAADFFGGLLRVFTTSGGVPASVTGSPFSSGLSEIPHAVLHPAGLYMLADFTGDRIAVYQVAGTGADTTLTAVSGSPFPSGGTGPRVLALSETGDFLFAANSTSHNIASFSVDASGQLTSVDTQPPNTLGTVGTVTGLVFVPMRQSVTSPPSIAAAFEPSTIVQGDNTNLTVTLGNPNSWYLSGVAFTDALPAGMIVANPAVSNSCGGTVTVADDLRSITLADGSIPASGSCTVSVTITGTTVGAWTDVTGNIESTEGGAGGTASATLTVNSPPVFDYTMSAAPASLTFLATSPSTQTSAIKLEQSPNGIAEMVTLTAAWVGTAPDGVTWTQPSPSQVIVPLTGAISADVSVSTTSASPSQGTLRITGTSTSGVTRTVDLPISILPALSAPTCGCTKTGSFESPAVKGLVHSSSLATVTPADSTIDGQLTLTRNDGTTIIENEPHVSAFGFSPNGQLFVLVTQPSPGLFYLNLYSVPDGGRVGRNDPMVINPLSWGFSPDDGNRYLVVTTSTNVNSHIDVAVYDTGTGVPVMQYSVTNYSSVPKWADKSGGDNDAVVKGTEEVGGWGFSPDGHTFVLSYSTQQIPQPKYFLGLWNLARGTNAPLVGEIRADVASIFQFSPCGDLFMWVSQMGSTPATSDYVQFLFTSNGQPYQQTLSLVVPAQEAPAATVVTKPDGSPEIDLIGMSKPSLASPQCSMSFMAFSPVNIALTDETGRRTGFDPASNGVVNQIPGGSYTGVGSEPQTVAMPYVPGPYLLDALGLDSLTSPAPYTLRFATIDAAGDVFDQKDVVATASRGSEDVYSFTVGNGPLAPVATSRDVTAPDIRCAPPDGQWHASDVSLACTATDSGSGLASPADASFVLATHVASGVETSNASTDSRQVCDTAGNCAVAPAIGGNQVDKRPPSIVLTAPGGSYLLGQAVAANYSCADGGSGVAACGGPVPSGATIDTADVGTHSFEVRSVDGVGNGSATTASYTVAYDVKRVYSVQAKQSGSTYPVKIQLDDAMGTNVSAAAIVVHAVGVIRVANDAPEPLGDAGNANPDMDFRYDASLSGYIFNLSLSGYESGTYYLQFTAGNDPAVHNAPFEVK